MRDRITVATTTHFVASCPSTRLISRTLESFQEAFGSPDVPLLISYDIPPARSPEHLQYLANLESLKDRFPGVDVTSGAHRGLRGSFLQLMTRVETPYLIFLEHDWVFLQKIALQELVKTFDRHPFVKHVRFNKRSNIAKGCDVRVEAEPRAPELALTRTWCFSNNPYMARTEFIRRECLPLVERGRRWQRKRKYGVEKPVDRSIKRDVKAHGFEAAHRRWGTYLYGPPGGPATVRHLDGASLG